MPRVEEHLARCASCRQEFDQLRVALDALRRTSPLLAPRKSYLTAGRLFRLIDADASRPRTIRLVTFRRLVAAAAVAVILVSAVFIAGDVVHVLRRPEQEPVVAVQPRARIPVVLTSTGRDEPMRVVRTLTVRADGRLPTRPVRLVGASSAGLTVPADHVFYDPEESSHWW